MAYYIESYQDLGRHPKTARLAKLLGVSKVTAVGHLQYLWWWCLDYAPDGDLSKYSVDEIADGAMWEEDPNLFCGALLQSGFIDDDAGLWSIHDWDQYGGKLIQRRRADAERKSVARSKQLERTSEGCPTDVPRKSDVEKRREENLREEGVARTRGGPPALEVFLAHADRAGVSRTSAEKCWLHYETVGWPNNGGIVKYDLVLKKWNLGDIQRAHNAAPVKNGTSPPSSVPSPGCTYQVDVTKTDPEIARLKAQAIEHQRKTQGAGNV